MYLYTSKKTHPLPRQATENNSIQINDIKSSLTTFETRRLNPQLIICVLYIQNTADLIRE